MFKFDLQLFAHKRGRCTRTAVTANQARWCQMPCDGVIVQNPQHHPFRQRGTPLPSGHKRRHLEMMVICCLLVGAFERTGKYNPKVGRLQFRRSIIRYELI